MLVGGRILKLRDFSLCRLKSVLTSRHCFLEIKIIRNGNGLDINPLHSTAVIVNKNNVGTFIKEFFKHIFFYLLFYPSVCSGYNEPTKKMILTHSKLKHS